MNECHAEAVRIGTAVAGVFVLLAIGGAVVAEVLIRQQRRRERRALDRLTGG